jgi:hypothetical protein
MSSFVSGMDYCTDHRARGSNDAVYSGNLAPFVQPGGRALCCRPGVHERDSRSICARTMFGTAHTASSASHRHGRWQCQQYPCKRLVVTRAGARPSDCNVSETVCSRADGERQEALQSGLA